MAVTHLPQLSTSIYLISLNVLIVSMLKTLHRDWSKRLGLEAGLNKYHRFKILSSSIDLKLWNNLYISSVHFRDLSGLLERYQGITCVHLHPIQDIHGSPLANPNSLIIQPYLRASIANAINRVLATWSFLTGRQVIAVNNSSLTAPE